MRSLLTSIFLLIILCSCVSKESPVNLLNEGSNLILSHGVQGTSPADGEIEVQRESAIVVYFTLEVDSSTISANTANSTCNGNIGVSSDNFSTCVQISHYEIATDKKTVTLYPMENLDHTKLYRVRVIKDVKSSAGDFLSNNFYHTQGFTVSPVNKSPTIKSITPTYGSTTAPITSDIVIEFSEPMNSSSISASNSGTTCQGTIQLSLDPLFSSCLPFATSPIPSVGTRRFTLTPKNTLTEDTTVYLRVFGVEDMDGGLFQGIATHNFTTTYDRKVLLSWAQSRESGVNEAGGGYRVYYSNAPIENIHLVSSVDVPFDGSSTPTQKEFTFSEVGKWYFKVVAYSSTNLSGSEASEEVVIDVN